MPDGLLRLRSATLLLGWGDEHFLAVTTPKSTVKVLPAADQIAPRGFQIPNYPSISRDGTVVACVRLKSIDPQRVAVATFSLPDQKWVEYDEAESISAVAISPDGSKLAYAGNKDRATADQLTILNLKTGDETVFPAIRPSGAISWSADESHVVYEGNPAEFDYRPRIFVISVATGRTSQIATGMGPSWSPSGDWIAFFDYKGTKCFVIRPDGTGIKTLTEVPHGFLKARGRFFLAPVWSPDSKKLLLNELMNEDTMGTDVLLFDLVRGKSQRKLKDGVPVLGWAEAK